jgi:hypothetical protein
LVIAVGFPHRDQANVHLLTTEDGSPRSLMVPGTRITPPQMIKVETLRTWLAVC